MLRAVILFFKLIILFLFIDTSAMNSSYSIAPQGFSERIFVAMNKDIFKDVQNILDNGSTVKDTLSGRIICREKKAFKAIKNCYPPLNNQFESVKNRVAADWDKYYSHIQITLLYDKYDPRYISQVFHDTQLPTGLLQYTIDRLQFKEIDPQYVNIYLINEKTRSKEDIKKLLASGNVSVATGFIKKGGGYVIAFAENFLRFDEKTQQATIDHEIEHLVQKHSLFADELAYIEENIFCDVSRYLNPHSIKTEQLVAKVNNELPLYQKYADHKIAFHHQQEFTADQIPALESIEKVAAMKGMCKQCAQLQLMSGSLFGKNNLPLFGIISAGSIVVLAFRILKGNSIEMKDISNLLAVYCAAGGYLFLKKAGHALFTSSDSHPSLWGRYKALSEIEKYLKIEQYLKTRNYKKIQDNLHFQNAMLD